MPFYTKECIICKKKFKTYYSNKKLCSTKCQRKDKKIYDKIYGKLWREKHKL